jgi:pimeloyl-ACP methyl ester carboxylesterase
MLCWRARDSRRSGGRCSPMLGGARWRRSVMSSCGKKSLWGSLPGNLIKRGVRLTVALLLGGILAFSVTAEGLPVLLIYGFQPIPGVRPVHLWETMAEHLSGNEIAQVETITVGRDHEFYRLVSVGATKRDVYLSNVTMAYEPTWRDLGVYLTRFSSEMAVLRSVYDVTACHVVAHSMGGLIARAYAESTEDLPNGAVGEMAEGSEIRTLIMLATPNHGCRLAGAGELFTILGAQLAPGSEFLRSLNEPRWVDGTITALHPKVRYVSLAGQSCLGCGLRLDRGECLRACVEQGLAWAGSDLVVMMASAYLPGAEHCALIGYDHASMYRDHAVVEMIDRVLRGGQVPAAIFAPSLEMYDPRKGQP